MKLINSNLIESLSHTMRGYVKSQLCYVDKYSVVYFGKYTNGVMMCRAVHCEIFDKIIHFQMYGTYKGCISCIELWRNKKFSTVINCNIDIYPGLTDIEIKL